MHDTYYVVAHFHYVLSLGAVFRHLLRHVLLVRQNERSAYPEWAEVHFWTTFIGVNIVVLPAAFPGSSRHAAPDIDYAPEFAGWNYVSSMGAFMTGLSSLFFIGMLIWTLTKGRRVGDNYWGEGATTLEWTVSSPPPFHTFEEQPIIKEEQAH